MRIEWLDKNLVGQYQIVATPDEYDSYPRIGRLLLDQSPMVFHDDLLSVASFLTFSEYCSGEIHLPRRTSPEVAEAIQQFMAPIWVTVGPVIFEPRANPLGDGRVYLTTDISEWECRENRFDDVRTSTVCVLPSATYSGALVSASGILLASNSNVIDSASKIAGGYRATIAVALLYCATFRSSSIQLSRSLKVPDQEFQALQHLLASCKISLSLSAQ